MLVILAFKVRQEDQKFEAGLGYNERPISKPENRAGDLISVIRIHTEEGDF